MRKIGLIAKITYMQRIRSGTFLLLTFGLPVLMIVAGAVPALIALGNDSDQSVGYVDETGRFTRVNQVTVEETTFTMHAFGSVQSANTAYQNGEISGYLVIPEDYFQGNSPEYYAEETAGAVLEAGLSRFIRLAVLPDAPEWLIDRLEDPSTYEYVAINSGETLQEGIGLILRAATPAALGILFALALVFTSGQMGAAVVREKDQRAMEIVITSLRPYELVTGKVLGMTLLSLTQLGIWALGIGITLVLLLTSSGSFQLVAIPWKVFFWAIMLGIPAYFLYAFLAAGLGIIAGDTQQAQQLAGILGFLGMAPLWLLGVLIQSPNSPVMISLSLFPLTGPIFILLRMTIVEVPTWQMLASVAILIISLVATIWAITRIFRAAMLMYGQALKPRQIMSALRGA